MLGIAFERPEAFVLLILAALLIYVHQTSRRARSVARARTTLAIRLFGLVLLVLALADPRIQSGTDRLSTVFVLDRSASVDGTIQSNAVRWIQNALRAKTANDRAAIISFARRPVVEQPLSTATDFTAPVAQLDASATDIASALRLALGTLPEDGARRIVLLSDGNQNRGDALAEIPTLRAAGVPVSVVPLGHDQSPEVSVSQLAAPPTIRRDERFDLRLTLQSTVETPATLRILIDGKLDSTQDLTVQRGTTTIVIPHAPLAPGQHVFQALIEPQLDTVAENNVGYATTLVAGPPHVLVVEGQPGIAKFLTPALKTGGLTVDTVGPATLGGDVALLRRYDSIVLANVAATDLSPASLLALQSYVRDFGGGLLVTGGDHSFGAGAYSRTPLEDMLPVTMDVHGVRAHAQVAITLVIDTSGSMGDGPPGGTKIELAREAALGATQTLSNSDLVGIVAFEETPRWIFPVQNLSNRALLEQDIGKLVPGGGTEIYPALKLAYDDMLTHSAKVRHIILMTDGLSPSGDYAGLAAQMRANKITLSTVAIGTDADVNFLRGLAASGNGRFYDATDPFNLPRMLIKETLEVARAAIVEGNFAPVRFQPSPILQGINGPVPSVRGYVATTAKPTSNVVLQTGENDPLLAEWPYGLGHVVAFTSDATNRWGANWVAWPAYSQFWTQAVKRTVLPPQSTQLQVNVNLVASQAHIAVNATDDSGHYLNGLTTTATIVSPTGEKTNLPLEQTAPGLYSADAPASGEGPYLVNIQQQRGAGQPPATQQSAFVVPYSAEFATLQPDRNLLDRLASGTGGAVLENPAASFAHTIRPADSATPIWPDLVALLIPLFLIDVAARRLRFGPSDVAAVAERLRVRWLGTAGSATLAASQLAAARRRSTVLRPQPTPAAATSVQSPRPRPAALASAGATTSATLLAAKRRAATQRLARR